MRSGWLLVVAACSYEPERQDPVDATPVVDTFEPARDCPAGYTTVLAGQTSRYRLILGAGRPWEHSDDCNDDSMGRITHLVAIDDQAELDAVEAAVEATGNIDSNKVWIGGVQLRDQPSVSTGWLSITGGPLLDIWNQGEPNDAGTENNGENFVGLERGRQGLVDFPNGDDQGAMCECDGKPPAPAALAAIDANRP